MGLRDIFPSKKPLPTEVPQNTEIIRYNQLTADEKIVIEKLCLEIGKKYAELHSEDFEEAFAQQMHAIADSQKKIDLYDMQIQLHKGVLRCPKCGNEAPKGSKFCNNCGHPIPELRLEDYEHCRKCNALVKKGTDNCPICDAPMAQPMPESDLVQCPGCHQSVGRDNNFCPLCGISLASTEPQLIPVTEIPAVKICSNCNAKVSADMRFCTECGFEL